MAIQTNITLTAPQKEYFQRFVNLSVNDQPLPQGDATIRISPFDDYFLFTLYDDVDGEDTPIDLSNVGNIFMNFIGTTDEIDIKNHTQVEEVDLSQGQVLFRITRSDSKKILALNNNNFYISTKMIDESDGSISDESVVYQGIWLAFDDASRISLNSQIEEQRIEYSIQLGNLQDENTKLKEDNAFLVTSSGEDDLTIQQLQNSNTDLIDEIAVLSADLDSTTVDALNRAAADAQLLAVQRSKIKQQSRALSDANRNAQTAAQRKGFYKQAAGTLQNYSLANNAVSQAKGSNNSLKDNEFASGI
jgi:hypothetical protein|tara:strand:+ start:1227 stop:2138 length:912 start_codon:yes stop_codon:yes gene_type:complete